MPAVTMAVRLAQESLPARVARRDTIVGRGQRWRIVRPELGQGERRAEYAYVRRHSLYKCDADRSRPRRVLPSCRCRWAGAAGLLPLPRLAPPAQLARAGAHRALRLQCLRGLGLCRGGVSALALRAAAEARRPAV